MEVHHKMLKIKVRSGREIHVEPDDTINLLLDDNTRCRGKAEWLLPGMMLSGLGRVVAIEVQRAEGVQS